MLSVTERGKLKSDVTIIERGIYMKKKYVITAVAIFALGFSTLNTGHMNNPFVIEVQAAETYSENWKIDESGTWWYYMEDGSLAKNCWIADYGEWYLLDENGAMRTGVVKSNGGKYYLLDTVRGTGYYGRMIKNGGTYNGVRIEADTSGSSEGALSDNCLQALRDSGIEMMNVVNVENTKHVENGKVTSENTGNTSQPSESNNQTAQRDSWI